MGIALMQNGYQVTSNAVYVLGPCLHLIRRGWYPVGTYCKWAYEMSMGNIEREGTFHIFNIESPYEKELQNTISKRSKKTINMRYLWR